MERLRIVRRDRRGRRRSSLWSPKLTDLALMFILVLSLLNSCSHGAGLRAKFIQGDNYYAGRGRGMGRPWLYTDPADLDPAWWDQPPPVGPDPFMRGFSQRVYPRYPGGLGHDVTGGSLHHNFPRNYNKKLTLWGASYSPSALNQHEPMDNPQWRDWAFSKRPKSSEGTHQERYYTPRDSFGLPPTEMRTFLAKDHAPPPPADPTQDWLMPALSDPPTPGEDEGGSEDGEEGRR